MQLCAGHLEAQRRQAEEVRANADAGEMATRSLGRIRPRSPLGIGERPDWHHLAACRGRTEAFFPTIDVHAKRGDPDPYAEARKLCAACPVVEPCREAGRSEHHGMWAGTTPGQRRPRRHRAA